MSKKYVQPMMGFTLVELLIAIVIIGIIASLSYPTYTEYLQQARRADAQSNMVEYAALAERIFTINNDYRTATVAAAGLANQTDYNYTVVFTPINAVATAFTLTAIPIGAQVGDRCQTLTINQLGVTGAVGNNATAIANCW